MKTFESYLQEQFMLDYHGDKDHFENAFDRWLSELDGNDLIQYAEEIVKELNEKLRNAIRLSGEAIDELNKIRGMVININEINI